MIAVLHAYSRHNAGDGLLVDLTLERLVRAGRRIDECVLYALDAESFRDIGSVRQVGGAGRRPTMAMLRSLEELAVGASARLTAGRVPPGRLAEEIHQATLIIGVGGGYLRTGTVLSSMGVFVNHLSQLIGATGAKAPKVYLPQSIGPLVGPVGAIVRRELTKLDWVCARDDRTVVEMLGARNVRRIPDLAVLQLADKRVKQKSDGSGPVICVARELGRDAAYGWRLRALESLLPDPIWAVQAEGIGTKHDARFYESLGVVPNGKLLDLLSKEPHSTVVSVRLHGALQAILAGVPAIHLSYQRKGIAAYSDLGLKEYVHDARCFDPEVVAQQVASIRADAAPFWRAVSAQYGQLADRSAELDEIVASYA